MALFIPYRCPKCFESVTLIQPQYKDGALKSQSQCRKTLKTLFEIKNPKTPTFIKEQSNTQINVKQTSGDL